MTFSIIVPVHNAESYIREMLGSILPQLESGDVDAELILIENGSDDNSGRICDDCADRYSYVHSYHYGKIGAYNARREGMKKACGDWLIFADADDLLCETALMELKTSIERVGKLKKVFDILLYNAGTTANPSKRKFHFPFEQGKVYAGDDKSTFYEVMCEGDSLNAMWNKCIRNDLAKKALDSNFGERLNHGEDLLQTAVFMDLSEGIVFFDKIIYLYRVNDNGLTGGYHPEFMSEQEKAWKLFDEYAQKWCGDKNTNIITARKALTCCIGVKRIIYSLLPLREKKKKISEITKSGFYKKYHEHELPDWAPEEDCFVHGLMCDKNAKGSLLLAGVKYTVKTKIKRAFKNGL